MSVCVRLCFITEVPAYFSGWSLFFFVRFNVLPENRSQQFYFRFAVA